MKEEGKQPRRVIYIAGYGRSGSTLLGRLMAQNDPVLDLGEVGGATRHLSNRKRRCTCGRTVTECPVWSHVPPGLVPRRKQYADPATHRTLLETATAATEHRLSVDSSKTAGPLVLRPFYLDRSAALQLTLVHLVRDPRAVLWSILRSRIRRKQPLPVWLQFALAVKVSAGWMMANSAAGLFRLRHRGRSVLVRYEEIVREGAPEALCDLIPADSLEGRKLGFRPGNHHAMAGNRMRNQKSIVVTLDQDWRESLPPAFAALVTIFCLPFMMRYGFLSRRAREVPTTSGDGTRRNASRERLS